MAVDVLLGLQWGDEGKGKIVDVLTPTHAKWKPVFRVVLLRGHSLEFNGISMYCTLFLRAFFMKAPAFCVTYGGGNRTR